MSDDCVVWFFRPCSENSSGRYEAAEGLGGECPAGNQLAMRHGVSLVKTSCPTCEGCGKHWIFYLAEAVDGVMS